MRAKEIIVNENVNLFEINMSPSSLRQLASGIDARAGMEFEMIVPGAVETEERELEPDYDEDVTAKSIDQVVDFFEHDVNSRRALAQLRDQLYEQYSEWMMDQFDRRRPAAVGLDDAVRDELSDSDVIEILGLNDDTLVTDYKIGLAIEKVLEDQIEPYYESAYSTALDSWMQSDHEKEWLRVEYPYMSDIESNFDDVHWPYYTNPESESSVSVDNIAYEFGQAIGRKVNAADTYHKAPRNPGEYAVEPDSSLQPYNEDSESGLEFISPPLPVTELLSDLQKVKQWADSYGCYTNDSTGLHINVSVPNLETDNLDYVKLVLLLGDEYVSTEFGRLGNRYAKSAFEKIKKAASNPNIDATPLLDQMRSQLGALASKVLHTSRFEKFTSIHPKEGYIEFRSPGGDWLGENFNLIENTLLRFVVALDAACDPEKYRKEYLTKLYKLLQVKGAQDPISYFAQYAAGELPAQALKSFIRSIQRSRTPAASNLTKPPMASTASSNRVTKTSSNGFNYVPVSATGSGPITGDDAWVILVGDVPQGRVRGATQSDANEAARQWVIGRSREWLADHEGQVMEVVPLSSPHVQELLRQTGR